MLCRCSATHPEQCGAQLANATERRFRYCSSQTQMQRQDVRCGSGSSRPSFLGCFIAWWMVLFSLATITATTTFDTACPWKGCSKARARLTQKGSLFPLETRWLRGTKFDAGMQYRTTHLLQCSP